MFKKSQRLSRTSFIEYFKIGRRFQDDNFTLVYSPAPLLAVAVVVGKKVHKQAVDRNTLRRRVYAAVRQSLEVNQITTGIYIVISKPAAKNINRVQIIPAITTLLALTNKSR